MNISEANTLFLHYQEKPEGSREIHGKMVRFWPLSQLLRIALQASKEPPLFDYDPATQAVICSWLGSSSRAPVVASRIREKQDPVFLALDGSAISQARRTALLGLMVGLPDPDQEAPSAAAGGAPERERTRAPIDTPHCSVCGDHLPEKVAHFSMKKFRTHLCLNHQKGRSQ